MNEPDETIARSPIIARSCRVEGCSCQDGRIVSHRHAAFFASLAHARGQTADRKVAPEPGWLSRAETPTGCLPSGRPTDATLSPVEPASLHAAE